VHRQFSAETRDVSRATIEGGHRPGEDTVADGPVTAS
jgi:hypothetical protein